MRPFLSSLAITGFIFFLVTFKQGFRRWFGLKGLFFPQVNDVLHDPGFAIPSGIQRRFRRIVFWRTLLRSPFLWEAAAKQVHDDLLAHLKATGAKPREPTVPPYVDWAGVMADPAKFYDEYVVRQRPCVLRGVPYDRKLWQTAHVREIWGDKPMMVHDIADSGRSRQMTLEEMVAFNESGQGCAYMSFNRTFFDVNKQLLTGSMCAEEMHELLRKRKKPNGDLRVEAQLFISTPSNHPTQKLAHTYMHCANNLNMFFNVEGVKRWVLVDPEYSLCCYPSTHFRNTAAYLSLIRAPTEAATSAETERFPLYAYCPKYQVDLQPGDVLFIPCWWWHSVETLTPATFSIAVRFGLTAFGSLFPGGMSDPNALFTSLQVLFPGMKREVFDVLHTRARSATEGFDGGTLRKLDERQEVEKDYDIALTVNSATTVRMWRGEQPPA